MPGIILVTSYHGVILRYFNYCYLKMLVYEKSAEWNSNSSIVYTVCFRKIYVCIFVWNTRSYDVRTLFKMQNERKTNHRNFIWRTPALHYCEAASFGASEDMWFSSKSWKIGFTVAVISEEIPLSWIFVFSGIVVWNSDPLLVLGKCVQIFGRLSSFFYYAFMQSLKIGLNLAAILKIIRHLELLPLFLLEKVPLKEYLCQITYLYLKMH